MTLEFPEACLYGKLGEWAKQLDTPLGLAYPALIGAWSAKPDIWERVDGEPGLINMFVGLIAPPGGGKGTAMDRAVEITGLRYGMDYDRAKLGGDLQVTLYLGDKATGKKGDKTRIPGPKKS